MNITGKHIRLWRTFLSLIFFFVLAGMAIAQDVTITNLAHLAEVAFSANYSFYVPWTPWQIDALSTSEPWWLDCSQMDCADLLSTSTNSCATLQMHGVTVTFATLTKNILTGETLLYSGCSTNVIATIAAPSGYEPGTQLGYNAWVWREWEAVTNCLDCWGLTAGEIPPPIVTLKTRLADASTYSVYQSNVVADAEAAAAAWESAFSSFTTSGRFTAMDGGGMMLMDDEDSCTITDETLPFSVTQIDQDGSGNTYLTWTSCTDHIYGVFSSSDLSNWVGIAAMWGDDLSTTWEDTNTAGGVTTQFYKIVRIPPDEGYNGDAIPSGWAVDNGLNPLDPNLDNEDPDTNFWSNLAEYQNGPSPTNSTGQPPLTFTINGGTNETTNAQMLLGFPGLVADYVIISESITMSNSVTNAFVSPLTYTLLNTNDGLHTIFLQLLKAYGTLSPVFGSTVELDTHPPSLSITSPTNGVTVSQRRINIEGFAADASTTNAAVSDVSRPLQVTVNGDFINDRDTNGVWWSAQDLVAGTNTFTAIATDRAGNAVTNSVWLIYDSTLATNVPVFTLDVTNTVTVSSNATIIAVSGGIDDDNATIQIDVLDAIDNTITNATVSVAVHGTNWWGEVPVVPGSNMVVVSAANSASPAATNGFTIIQSTNVFLEIDGPAADIDVNATNVMVVGRASTNFNGSITINGLTAFTTNGPDGITFSNSVPINSVDANVIEVDATGTDGSSATARQIVYGYEVVAFNEQGYEDTGLSGGELWFQHHYDLQLMLDGNSWVIWGGPGQDATWALQGQQSYADGSVNPYDDYSGTFAWDPSDVTVSEVGNMNYSEYHNFNHLDASSYEHYQDCPWDQDCQCLDTPPYCIGQDTGTCCVNTTEQLVDNYSYQNAVTFIKHWPVDEEQTVILHFTNFWYFLCSRDCSPGGSQDPKGVTLWGQPGMVYSTNSSSTWGIETNVGFLIKIKTNTRYVLHDTDFTVPSFTKVGQYQTINSESTVYTLDTGYDFAYDSFENSLPNIVGPNRMVSTTDAVGSNVVLTATGYLSTSTFQWSTDSQNIQFVGATTGRTVTISPIQGRFTPPGSNEVVTLIATFDGETITNTFNIVVQTPSSVGIISQVAQTTANGPNLNIQYQVLDQNRQPLRCVIPVGSVNVRIATLLASEQLVWQCNTICTGAQPEAHDVTVRDDGTFFDTQSAPTGACGSFVRSQVLLVGIGVWPYQGGVGYKCICFDGARFTCNQGTANGAACCTACGQ